MRFHGKFAPIFASNHVPHLLVEHIAQRAAAQHAALVAQQPVVLIVASQQTVTLHLPRHLGRFPAAQLLGGGADIAIEPFGNPATIRDAFSTLRPGGRLVVIGYTDHNVALNAGRMMYREMEIRGSLGCRPVDYACVLELARTDRIEVASLVTA